MKKLLIVGAGLFGSVFARLAKDKGYSVTVIDKREHIGGNIYTKKVNDIDVHWYGPHIFHTNSDDIWSFVNRYSEFIPYHHSPRVFYKNKIYSFPINLLTFNQLFGVNTPEEAKNIIEEKRFKHINPEENFENYCLHHIGKDLYETFFYGYTVKQWKKEPKELPASIIKRLPIRFNFNDNYFKDKYSGIPKNGYTELAANLLDNVNVELGVDFFKERNLLEKTHDKVIYTGSIDQLFDYSLGKLEWRSLRFENEIIDKEDYQGCSQMNFTDKDVPYTRITEHKHFNWKNVNSTIITREYPEEYNEQREKYYSVNTENNNELYRKYLNLIPSNYIVGGRLGSYHYYDMDQIIAQAIKKFSDFDKS